MMLPPRPYAYIGTGALILILIVYGIRAHQEEHIPTPAVEEMRTVLPRDTEVAPQVPENVQPRVSIPQVLDAPEATNTGSIFSATSTSIMVADTHKKVLATIFWVGERATRENGFIANDQSAWDSSWQKHFGGVDDPDDRCGFVPCDFTPQENPFYVALPYNDLTDDGERKMSASFIPWINERSDDVSMLKNTWVELQYGDRTCYAQWQDVGPFESDDVEHVFGDALPRNTFGVGAGIDVSPAVRDCLKMPTNVEVGWKFIDATLVPEGPWTEVITTRPVHWE